jgi:hypothetical protein
MAHPTIESAGFAVEPLFMNDENGAPLLVPLVQSTYAIVAPDRLARLEEQPRPSLTGELWGEDAAVSSYRIEPPCAFTKPGTDVVLLGHAQARNAMHRELTVTFRVGPVGKQVRVTGDRVWVRTMGSIHATEPLPFSRMPLCYERAFGGWDRSSADPAKHTFEPRNPVGTGFRAPGSPFEEGLRLPNLEDPAEPLTRLGDVVRPAGFGFLSPDWQPRLSLAGTFDERWQEERMPLYPEDFDRRFFNAGSPGLVTDGHLRGDEPVLVENASPLGRLSFRLPGERVPTCRVRLAYGPTLDVPLALDTVIVATDAGRVMMLYRGHLALPKGPHDVRAIRLGDGTAPRAARGMGEARWA